MPQEFKIIREFFDRKIHKDKTQEETFEEKVNLILQQGWKLLNAQYATGPPASSFIAFFIREV